MAEQHSEKKMSRRRFIRNSGYVAGGLVGGGIIGGLIGANMNDEQEGTNTQGEHQGTSFLQAPLYFTNPEMFAVLVAASERIFPSDDNGPGADELGVAYYIDHSLAGSWGNNAREYMQGPFFPGSNFQGYQSPLKRHEVFDTGIKALQKVANDKHDKNFPDLEGEQQDAILTSFQNDEVELKGVTSKTFFNILRAATIEGVYADPAYGGNINMEGWKMKNYPGHQMSYYDKIESDEFMEIEPQALHSYTK
ncbi:MULTISPECIES: gluconate 2-dehydrogenase subunit 3 family protein [Cytobacillus]|uniref:gluconate 2-dehydrogenase subunit 3 family protein n=1 Tax=Cytobacillus TaxID=2675230 RepID=UPI001CD32E0C|nr:gluconate 2-dehydrogenase subunit 3 family protein [Cytobacillus kochii]MCA1024964.1 gluconate 2-dehydrogenase subunit 3 family protein [Cytobacillus kochii]MCM3324059.1 gluconate 2-dehydrogenase subunit 3 family protein [Cytobacillus kochii]MCM3346537.1 gluconate 2-dehydrogenase subunit 3 family protein [Cytobacillus kochii]MDM5206656.1 gluconate 2-dehydrogenase subunit 3 family protein [Cytobacillus kochii]